MFIKYSEKISNKFFRWFLPNNAELNNFFSLIYYGNRIVTSSLLLRKYIFDSIDGFEVAPYFKAIEDLDLLLKMSINGFKFHDLQKD